MRVPVQPMGCPIAIEPPLTLSLSIGSGRSRNTASTCAAKASFNSMRSKSSRRSCVRTSSFCTAGTGPMPMLRGSTPALAQPRMRASGVTCSRLARSALINTTAAPPSVMPDDDPAVMMPGAPSTSRKTSGSLRRLSSVVPGRGCSSTSSIAGLPFASAYSTGTISSRNRPSAMACSARRWLSSAYASESSRVMPYSRARTSAVSPMIMPQTEQVKPSRYIASTSVKFPIRCPHRASSASTRYGMRLMDSMPPASTTSDSPSMIACAPLAIVCMPDAQALLMVCAGALVGMPARTATCRAGLGPEPA